MEDKTKQVHVSEEKKELVKELAALIESKNTILLASIKGLPAAQFQKIKKSLSADVDIKVPKKRMLKMAIDSSKKSDIKELDKHLKEDIAVLISDMDAFELSERLGQSKSPVKAKTGQEASEDIEIEAGVTDLPAGPAVSELGSLGLQVKVTDGKIEIMKTKVVVEKGKTISEVAAGVMSKLDILPFTVGFVPDIAYDSATGKIFGNLIIDKEATLSELQTLFGKARSFAMNIGLVNKETLGLLLGKAAAHEGALSKLVKGEVAETPKEDVEAPKEEEKTEEALAEVKEEIKPEEEKKNDIQPESKSEETQ